MGTWLVVSVSTRITFPSLIKFTGCCSSWDYVGHTKTYESVANLKVLMINDCRIEGDKSWIMNTVNSKMICLIISWFRQSDKDRCCSMFFFKCMSLFLFFSQHIGHSHMPAPQDPRSKPTVICSSKHQLPPWWLLRFEDSAVPPFGVWTLGGGPEFNEGCGKFRIRRLWLPPGGEKNPLKV